MLHETVNFALHCGFSSAYNYRQTWRRQGAGERALFVTVYWLELIRIVDVLQ